MQATTSPSTHGTAASATPSASKPPSHESPSPVGPTKAATPPLPSTVPSSKSPSVRLVAGKMPAVLAVTSPSSGSAIETVTVGASTNASGFPAVFAEPSQPAEPPASECPSTGPVHGPGASLHGLRPKSGSPYVAGAGTPDVAPDAVADIVGDVAADVAADVVADVAVHHVPLTVPVHPEAVMEGVPGQPGAVPSSGAHLGDEAAPTSATDALEVLPTLASS
jgi:hypothetical protein